MSWNRERKRKRDIENMSIVKRPRTCSKVMALDRLPGDDISIDHQQINKDLTLSNLKFGPVPDVVSETVKHVLRDRIMFLRNKAIVTPQDVADVVIYLYQNLNEVENKTVDHRSVDGDIEMRGVPADPIRYSYFA